MEIEKENEKNNSSSGGLLVPGLLSGELFSRCQKITEALYRVTELFSDKEPLKWQLRESAVDFFNFLASRKDDEIFDAEKALPLINRISCLLQLAYESSAFVSSINFEILRREYLAINDTIESHIAETKQELPLVLFKGQSQARELNSNGQKHASNGHNGQVYKLSITPKESKEESTKEIKDNDVISPIILKERKRKVLSVIKNNEWLTIRDVCSYLPELKEKSVQRDLLELVNAGVVKKIGDKRWRKYSLI